MKIIKSYSNYNESKDERWLWDESSKIFFVTYGCGGGLNDINYELYYGTQIESDAYAWEEACQIYDSYAGLHGILDYDGCLEEIKDEYEDEDDAADAAEQMYNDERESWLEYFSSSI